MINSNLLLLCVVGKKRSKEEVLTETEVRVIEQRKNSKDEPIENPPAISSSPHLGIYLF